MIVVGSFFLAVLLLLVILLQVRAYYLLKQQNKVITGQSEEIKKQNQTLARQNQQLNELNLEKQQIIGVVSHDLKGPFNRIFALIQLLKMSAKNLSDEQKEYLEKINQVSVDGLSMVRNLLDSRQLEDRLYEMEMEDLKLEAFVNSFVHNYREVAAKKNIELVLRCPGEVLVSVDRLFLYRILDNILSNAIKFSNPNTSVSVIVDPKPDVVLLSVRDQGPGISEEEQKKLYRKFQQLSAKPTGGESTTGLGLSIVKALVDKMGATITCESKLGEGTNFIVGLKRSQSNK